MKEFLSSYQTQLIETVIILGLLIFIYFAFYLYSRKIKNVRLRQRFISRAKFVIQLFFFVLMFFIWIPGFWRVIAVLGFVAGAFVLTQKHNIENLFGYFIINWRSLFVVGDIVKIQNYFGKIQSLGLFYFTMQEVQEIQEKGLKCNTGNVIKIPNGFVSKHPSINYSDSKYIAHCLTYVVEKNISINHLENEFENIINTLKESFNNMVISVKYNLQQSEPKGIKITIFIKSYQEDFEKIQCNLEKQLLDLENNQKIKLV